MKTKTTSERGARHTLGYAFAHANSNRESRDEGICRLGKCRVHAGSSGGGVHSGLQLAAQPLAPHQCRVEIRNPPKGHPHGVQGCLLLAALGHLWVPVDRAAPLAHPGHAAFENGRLPDFVLDLHGHCELREHGHGALLREKIQATSRNAHRELLHRTRRSADVSRQPEEQSHSSHAIDHAADRLRNSSALVTGRLLGLGGWLRQLRPDDLPISGPQI